MIPIKSQSETAGIYPFFTGIDDICRKSFGRVAVGMQKIEYRTGGPGGAVVHLRRPALLRGMQHGCPRSSRPLSRVVAAAGINYQHFQSFSSAMIEYAAH